MLCIISQGKWPPCPTTENLAWKNGKKVEIKFEVYQAEFGANPQTSAVYDRDWNVLLPVFVGTAV